jgi:hypothetical protein
LRRGEVALSRGQASILVEAMSSNKQKRKQARQKKERKAKRNKLQAFKEGRLHHGVSVPDGAIPADVGKQRLNAIGSNARPYYQDLDFECVDCGAHEVWTAEQQRWWYEVARGPLESTAIRCKACRARRKGRGGTGAAASGAHELARIRSRLLELAAGPETPEAREELEAALSSKWEGIQVIAGRILAAWGGDLSRASLRAWLERLCDKHANGGGAVAEAAEALAHVVEGCDADWILELYLARSQPPKFSGHAWELLPLLRGLPPDDLFPRLVAVARRESPAGQIAALEAIFSIALGPAAIAKLEGLEEADRHEPFLEHQARRRLKKTLSVRKLCAEFGPPGPPGGVGPITR